MRHLTLASALLLTTGIAAPALADGHLQIVDEPLELTIQMNHARYPVYDENWPVEKAASAWTGIHLKDATVGANTRTSENDGKTEALNLMLASGEIPDIVGSSRLKDFVNQFGPEGAFIPLNDLIEEHAPNLKAYLDERPEIKSAISAADGNMYYIPYLPDGKYGRAYWIRTDWLKALGLEVPQTVDEYEAALRAFKTQDPNGNGLADEVPYFARQWPELIRLVTLWDGRSSGSDTYHDFYVDEGQLKHPYAGEGYREGIKNLARWYAEGLIDAEIFTRGSSSRDYLLSENLGGSTHDWFASTSGYKTNSTRSAHSSRRVVTFRITTTKSSGLTSSLWKVSLYMTRATTWSTSSWAWLSMLKSKKSTTRTGVQSVTTCLSASRPGSWAVVMLKPTGMTTWRPSTRWV